MLAGPHPRSLSLGRYAPRSGRGRFGIRIRLMRKALVFTSVVNSDWATISVLRMALSAFLNARGAPPPLALARSLRASLGPRALRHQDQADEEGLGFHERCEFRLGNDQRFAHGSVCISQCSRGPTPARSRSVATRLARAAGASASGSG